MNLRTLDERLHLDLHSLSALLFAAWFMAVTSHLPTWEIPTIFPAPLATPSFIELERYEFYGAMDVGTVRQQKMSEFAFGGNLGREFHRRDLGISAFRDREEYPALFRNGDRAMAADYHQWLKDGADFNKMPRWMWGMPVLAFHWMLLSAGDAWTRPIHGGLAVAGLGLCPEGAFTNPSGISDGCPGAPSGTFNNITLIQHSNFFTGYANQSGQSYTTRPGWNVAGVDYPDGIPLATSFADPAVSLPSPCTYSATGNSVGGPQASCNYANGSTDTIDSFDFSGNLIGSHGCVAIVAGFFGATGGTQTFSKDYFAVNAACYGATNSSTNAMVATGPSAQNGATVNFSNDTFDFSPPVTATGWKAVSVGLLSQLDVTYTTFINIPQNPINGNSKAFSLLMEYDYIDEYVFNSSTQNHAEITDLNGSGTRPQYYWYFVTSKRGFTSNSGGGTANVWISSSNSADGSVFTDSRLRNLTVVNNWPGSGQCSGSGQCTTEGGLSEQDNTVTNGAVTDNFLDNTGGVLVYRVSNTTCTNLITWSGNIDLKSGGTITASSGITPTGTTPANGSGPGACA